MNRRAEDNSSWMMGYLGPAGDSTISPGYCLWGGLYHFILQNANIIGIIIQINNINIISI
jgi:hypothetical protein